jgi:crotonobetainyl-CoA:carnitine CoA-transferase CaiB-like acyl-CoA transferase
MRQRLLCRGGNDTFNPIGIRLPRAFLATPVPTADQSAMPMRSGMLTGYRVLDITQFVAGPVATRILADAGADVIKVELAPHGDRSRAQGLRPRAPEFRPSSASTYFFQHNHTKRSLALDFKHAKSRQILRELARRSDVLVENFAPGVMARAGLGYDELSRLNPKLVMCSISLAGQTGPLSGKPGYDYIAQAYSGITSLIGEPDRAPCQLPIALGDVSTGVAAAMAIAFALIHRERTGRGQHVEATLVDTYFHMHESNVPKVAIRGDAFVPSRSGSQHPDGGPVGVFRCANDEYITINVLAHQWAQFAQTLGRPELAGDPRFATAHARRDNNAEIVTLIEAWLQQFSTREEALAALERDRIPCAPVLTLNEAMGHPHLVERGTVRPVSDPRLGRFAVPCMPVRFSEWNIPAEVKADLLGESNDAILQELGFSAGEIAALYEERVLVRDPLFEDEEASAERGGP